MTELPTPCTCTRPGQLGEGWQERTCEWHTLKYHTQHAIDAQGGDPEPWSPWAEALIATTTVLLDEGAAATVGQQEAVRIVLDARTGTGLWGDWMVEQALAVLDALANSETTATR